MYLTLLFDTEDFITPSSDDDARDLAEIMTRLGLRASFIVVGEKARVLAARGRQDVIAALQQHDIGIHTDMHSRHPTIAEFLEDKGWLDGIAEAEQREQPGVEAIQRVFGVMPSSWGIPGSSWGPQIGPALRNLGVPATVYPLTRTATSMVHWFAGGLTYGTGGLFDTSFDFYYSDDAIFERKLQELTSEIDARLARGVEWSGLFVCHPTTMRALEFWDAVNFAKGANPDPSDYRLPALRSEEEYQAGLRNYERLMRFIAGHPQLEVRTLRELQPTFGVPADALSRDDLRNLATSILDSEGINTEDLRTTPAEAIDLLAAGVLALTRSGELASALPQHVAGPTDDPSDQTAPVDVAWPAFLSGVEAMHSYIAANNALPAAPRIPGNGQVGLGSFYRGLAAAFLAVDAGSPPTTITCPPCPGVPSIAASITATLHAALPTWPIHRVDLDDRLILAHTRRQTWTLRPARARHRND